MMNDAISTTVVIGEPNFSVQKFAGYWFEQIIEGDIGANEPKTKKRLIVEVVLSGLTRWNSQVEFFAVNPLHQSFEKMLFFRFKTLKLTAQAIHDYRNNPLGILSIKLIREKLQQSLVN